MAFFSYRNEQRQHISLSKHAYDTIVSDSVNFLGEKNFSGCINRIIENFWEDSIASISLSAKQEQVLLAEYLQAGKQLSKNKDSTDANSISAITEEETKLLHLITRGQIQKERDRLISYPKDYSLKIRLNNDVYDIMYPYEASQWPEYTNYPTQGAYIKAILEDYTRRSQYDREGIFYKDILDELLNHINSPTTQKRILEISYTTASGNEKKFFVKPYAISDESQAHYHYLIALSCPVNTTPLDFKPYALRISRIGKIKSRAKSFGSGQITKKQCQQIEEKIEKAGVPFFISDNDLVHVLLSPQGVKRFRTILHLRPIPYKQELLDEGYVSLHFDCTPAQIIFYFSQFCEDATIISPRDLSIQMCEHYENAAFNYQKALSENQ